ncbi:MAG: DUF2975 domain-containing protein [Clostridia bacterium]|nr:DUF2975 domain-containing protein [Clostridia bacterium]
MDKLVSAAKKLDVFFNVMRKIALVALIVVVCLTAVLTVVSMIDPDAVIGGELNIVDIGPVSIELAPEYAPSNGNILAHTWVMVLVAIVCGGTFYVGIGLIRRILQPMKEGRPFDVNTAGCVKKLAYCSLVLGVAQNVGRLAEAMTAVRAFGLDRLVQNEMIRSVSVNYTLELGFVVIFFVLMLVSYLFAYGAQLQQLSDETL